VLVARRFKTGFNRNFIGTIFVQYLLKFRIEYYLGDTRNGLLYVMCKSGFVPAVDAFDVNTKPALGIIREHYMQGFISAFDFTYRLDAD
jgi:hypothetical protein